MELAAKAPAPLTLTLTPPIPADNDDAVVSASMVAASIACRLMPKIVSTVSTVAS